MHHSKEIEVAFGRLFNTNIEGEKQIKRVLLLLIDILIKYKVSFAEQGFSKLNSRCIELLELIYYRLEDEYAIFEQAEYAFGEWLGVICIKTPDYILLLEYLLKKAILELKDEYYYKDLFLIYDIIHEGKLVEKSREIKSNYRNPSTSIFNGTKNLITNFVDERKNLKNQNIKQKDSGYIQSLLSEEKLKLLFNKLLLLKYIEVSTDFSEFVKAFSTDKKALAQPIIWTGKTTVLCYLFYMLERDQIKIIGKWQHHLGNVKRAFANKKNELITTRNFTSTLAYINKSRKDEFYRLMIKEIFDSIDGF